MKARSGTQADPQALEAITQGWLAGRLTLAQAAQQREVLRKAHAASLLRGQE